MIMKSYTIHLIRHGITQGNLLGQYIGITDSPLAPEGIKQLQIQSQQAAYPHAQGYYSSPLSRCVDTLKLLYPDASPTIIDDFRECDFGRWEGKNAQDLQNDADFIEWMQQGGQMAAPGGESSAKFIQRTCMAFEKLVESMLRSGQTSAVVVAHGGTLMAILSAYGLPRAPFYDWMTDPGCGYSLRITPGFWMRSMVAEVYETIPPRPKESQRTPNVIDFAREAAKRAYDPDKQTET